MTKTDEIVLTVAAATVGIAFVGLAAYRLGQFVVGFWEGLTGKEPPAEPRGFEVLPSPKPGEPSGD